MKLEQIAINGVSTAAQTALPDTLRAYAAAGFRNVELPFNRVKGWLKEGHDVAELRGLLDELGLRFIGGFEAGVSVFGGPEDREKNWTRHRENARLTQDLGGGGVIVAGTDGPPQKNLDALETVGQAFADLVESFPPSVSLALEFNWSPLVKSLKAADHAVQAASHPRVGILFDPAHYYCTPSRFEDLTPDVVSHILHVHVDDMRDKPGDLSDCNSDRVLPGEGVLDLPRLLGRIADCGYQGYYSLEMFSQEIWELPTEDAARRCYDAMARLTG